MRRSSAGYKVNFGWGRPYEVGTDAGRRTGVGTNGRTDDTSWREWLTGAAEVDSCIGGVVPFGADESRGRKKGEETQK